MRRPSHAATADGLLIFSTYFFATYCTYFAYNYSLRQKLFSTNDEHVFLRILVTNLRVLYYDIYAIPTMCTLYYQSRLNLVSEICLVNILTFSV